LERWWRATAPYSYEIRQEGDIVQQGTLPPSHATNFSIPPGRYVVRIADSSKPPWVLESPVDIGPGTTNLGLTFAVAQLTVTSEPAGVQVSWPVEAKEWRNDGVTNDVTPFTHQFRSGNIQFLATKRGYEDLRTSCYFYPSLLPSELRPFAPGVREAEGGQFTFVLAPWAVPHPGQGFRNSLNMEFLWVASKSCWASVYETRVSEFRQFVDETHYDATAGTYSLTTNGWEQQHCSWDHPSFSQTGDHPVIGVNYADATNFCKWLTEHEVKRKRLLAGQSYKLPTAEQWMALADGPFPTGEVPVGNYSGPEAADARWPTCWPVWKEHHDPHARTAPVGFSTNASLYCDLGGNAAEWCIPGLLAGGSWFDGESSNLQWLHTTNFLHSDDLSRRDERNGFRVVIEDTSLLASSRRLPAP